MALTDLVEFSPNRKIVPVVDKLSAMKKKYSVNSGTIFMLLDCSSSMYGDKLNQAKKGILDFAKNKKVSLIIFSSKACFVEMEAIFDVKAKGSTNMVNAIIMAIKKNAKKWSAYDCYSHRW
ncbi:hypothetical protein KAI92_00330 [Candidatus Parcubacteria bacterium]|nr:hypothetical protein [Candidatus Parcubacteria bacterium]